MELPYCRKVRWHWFGFIMHITSFASERSFVGIHSGWFLGPNCRGRRNPPKPFLSVSAIAETRPQLRNDNKVVTEPAGKTFMKSFSRSQSDWSIKVCYTYKLQQINNKICLFWPVADQWGMRDGATLWQRHGRYMKERDMSCNMFSVWSVHLRRHAKTRFHLRP